MQDDNKVKKNLTKLSLKKKKKKTPKLILLSVSLEMDFLR